ncbi:MAG: competence/damage-inducible protein A [Candidatus Krumholzibacteria bacterium]
MTQAQDARVILVGNELLKGERRDAHLAFVGRAMLASGMQVSTAQVVGDDRVEIARVIREQLRGAKVLIVCGGLGPTHDDVTREGVADALGLPLEFSEQHWKEIQRIFQKFGRRADKSNRQQAYFPKGATAIPNRRGTAPGFAIERDGCFIAVLPGPPQELIPMMEKVVLPRIGEMFNKRPLFTEAFRTAGVGESAMTPHLQPILDRHDAFNVSSLPHIGGVDIVITQKPDVVDRERVKRQAQTFEEELRRYLGAKLYAKGSASLESVVGRSLVESRATLAIAESITGGLIGKRFTDVPGSSRYLLADVVAYSNESKVTFLGVSRKALEDHGAVSEAVCREMAQGIRRETGATWAIATTGIAGPSGATEEKPVGLAFYGVSWDGGVEIRERVFPGNREDVRERVAFATMLLIYERLVGASGPTRS